MLAASAPARAVTLPPPGVGCLEAAASRNGPMGVDASYMVFQSRFVGQAFLPVIGRGSPRPILFQQPFAWRSTAARGRQECLPHRKCYFAPAASCVTPLG